MEREDPRDSHGWSGSNPQAMCAQRPYESLVPCDVLLDPHAAALPGHVCSAVLLESARRFQLRRAAPRSDPTFGHWPLPAGRQSLLQWRAIHAPDLPDERLPAPITDLAGAWVCLIVERCVGKSTVRLLGLCDEATVYRPKREHDITELQLLEPVLQTERTGPTTTGPDPVRAMERELSRWYERVVLERTVRVGGRPPGPSLSPERLRTDFGRAIATLLQLRQKLTQATVAAEMGISTDSLRRYARAGIIPRLDEI